MSGKADVIVIGAGFAGLKAAQELVAMGRSVILLEAKDRVGGRVKRAEVVGRVADVGGQWVGARHSMLLGEAERLGIATYKQYDNRQDRDAAARQGRAIHRRCTEDAPPGHPRTAAPADALGPGDEDPGPRPMRPWAAPRAAEWDGDDAGKLDRAKTSAQRPRANSHASCRAAHGRRKHGRSPISGSWMRCAAGTASPI